MSTDLSDRLSDHVFGGCVGGGEDSFGWLHGMGEVMECGLAVCKAVCCGAESFFFFFFFSQRLFARAVLEARLLDRGCT